MGEATTLKKLTSSQDIRCWNKQLYFPYSSRKTNKRARWPFFKVAVGANQAYNNIPSFTNGHTPLRPMTKTAMIQAPVDKLFFFVPGNRCDYRGRTVRFQPGKFMKILYINKQNLVATPCESSYEYFIKATFGQEQTINKKCPNVTSF